MKSFKLYTVIFLAGLVFVSGLFSSAAHARNYNYDVLQKAQSLQFDGTFTVERDGQTIDVNQLKPGDRIRDFSNRDAFDYYSGYTDPGECKQFAKIIAYEATPDDNGGNKYLPVNECIGACEGGNYYSNFMKNIIDVVPGDFLHFQVNSSTWHTMIALDRPELDENDNPVQIWVLDSNWKGSKDWSVRTDYHNLKIYPNTYGYSKGWEYFLSFVDQGNDKSSADPITLAPGESAHIVMRFRNEGREPWSNDPSKLTNIYLSASNHPLDPAQLPPTRHSDFSSNWVDTDWKVCYPNESTIEKGQTATFEFDIKAPAASGEYTEHFYPYHVSGGWVPNNNAEFPEVHLTIIVQDDQAIDVGNGAPTEDIRQAFINAYSSSLGSSTSTVQSAVSAFGTNGCYQMYKYGSIQYHSDGAYAGQTFLLYGKLYEKWGNLGYAASTLGFPVENRVTTTSSFGTSGTYQLFEGGSLQLNGIDPFAVYGTVYSKWGETTYADGPLGFPTSDRKETTSGFGTEGSYQCFEGGSIQIIGTNEYSVYGEIYNEWGHQGYATWAGFPTSHRYSRTGGECQDFEGGYVQSDGQSAQFVSTTHPTNLSGEVNSDDSVDLSWENRLTARGINVYRSGSPVERIAVLPPDVTIYTDQTAEEGKPYSYFLSAYNETAESQYSNQFITNVNAGLDPGPWPKFHHDAQNTGKSENNGVEYPFLKWKYQTEESITSSPAIGSDGTIYVGSYDNYLYAINPDKSLKWKYQTGRYISSSPAIGADGTIYVGSTDGYLYAINPDKSLKWKHQTGNYHSPAIGADGTIYVGSCSPYLFAINPDGSLKWKYHAGANIESSPAIGVDGAIYFGSGDNHLYAINPDGSIKWKYLAGSYISSSPAIGADGTIYVGSWDNHLYAINPDGSIKWRYRTGNNISSSPAIGADGTIYVGSDDNHLYAINPDKSLKWKHQTGGDIESSPAIGADGTIYVGSYDKYLYAFGLPEDKGYIHGKVTDISTDAVIASATISSSSGDTQSGTDGSYGIALDPGVYDITCSKTGYQAITIPDVVVTAGEGTELNIELTTPGVLDIITADLPPAETTIDYNPRVRITGGTYPYVYSIAYGTLPPGLTLDSEYGNISGTPTTSGSYTFAVGVTDSLNAYSEMGFTIEVTAPLTIEADSALKRGTIGEAYQCSIAARGGAEPYIFSVFGDIPLDLFWNIGGNIWNKITNNIDFNSGILNSFWKTSHASIESNQLFFDGSHAGSEAEIELDCINGNITFDYESYFGCGNGFCGMLYFYVDNQIEKAWNYSTSGKISIPVSAGKHVFKWESTNSNPDVRPWQYSQIDNITFPIELKGNHVFTVKVTDNSGRTAEKDFHMEIDDPLVVTTPRLNDGIVGEVYNQQLEASGGYGDYTWGVYSGTPPAGLSLDSESGVLSGTPTEATYRTIVVSVTDEYNRITYKDFTIQVSEPLQILTTSLPNGLIDTSYSEAIRLNGGIGPFQFSLAGNLPAGLSLNTTTGVISGIPTAAMYKNVEITVTDSTYPTAQTVSQYLSIRITSQLTILTSATLPNGKKGVAVNPIVLQAGGGPSPYNWSLAEGTMPPGITLDPQTGTLSGTPTGKGDFAFTIQVTDNNTGTAQKEFFWHISDVLTIVTGAVPDAGKGVPYYVTLEARGGLPLYSWRKSNGDLPAGLSINPSTGTIYGTPTATQTMRSFTIEVNDSDSPAQAVEKTFNMEVLDELYVYTKTIPNGRVDDAYTATVTASLGKPPYEWRLESGNLPPGLNLNSSSTVATIDGTPTNPGTYEFTLEVSDTGTPVKHATRPFSVEIYGDVTIQTTDLEPAVKGEDYSESIVVTGGDLPYTWNIIDGELPEGLTLTTSSGHISGITDLEIGHSSVFTVRVTDSGAPSDYDEKELVIQVIGPLTIVTDTIQGALQYSAYQATLEGEGGVSPYIWSIASGNLPEGITLSPDTGVLSGTPVSCGDFGFTVKLEDSSPAPISCTRAFTLNVLCADNYDIAGRITTLEGVLMTLSGDGSGSTTTDANGDYLFEDLSNGTYTITPSKGGYWFEPESREISITNLDVTGVDFVAHENQAPNTPSSPSPADGAPDVSTDAHLSWTGGDPDLGDTLTYDIYLGTNTAPPVVSTGQTQATYNPGTLSYGTLYYWKIVATDNHGSSSEGPVWSFTTKSAPSADISVMKDVDNPAPPLDTNIVFTITVTNNGPNDATGVQVTDHLPAGLMFLGDDSGGAYNFATGLWDIGALASGRSVSLHITAWVDQTGEMTNTVTRTASSPEDTNVGNDTASTSITVPPPAALSLDMDISTRNYDDTISSTDIEQTIFVPENDEAWIAVVAQGVTNLDTYQVEVSFDTEKVEFIEGVEDNPSEGIENLLKKNGGETTGFQAVENISGTVHIENALAQQDCDDAPEGTGIIALLKFRVLDTNQDNQLTLGNTFFTDCNDNQEEVTDLTHGTFTSTQSQMVSLIPDVINTTMGSALKLTVVYNVTDNDTTLSSLGVRIHFDSTRLEYNTFEDLFETNKLADPQLQDDLNNEDNDESTDKLIVLSYADPITQNWPNQPLPLDLVTLVFTVKDDAPEGLTSVNVTKITGHTGYDFIGTDSVIDVILCNLDVDGNGVADGGTDGIMLIRYLFEIRGNALIYEAVADDCTRCTAGDIEAFFNDCGYMLDVDGNGVADGGTDGIMLIRYLFEIRGDALTYEAVADDCTRCTADIIEGFLLSFIP
jgi:uncharacterized repeat protein (TIGR01451 family)